MLNGYDDWFLPSVDELIQMYQQKDAIGGFDSVYYWSSTQMGANPESAMEVSFADGVFSSNAKYVFSGKRVRAIRAF